ncbi:MAG: aldehyde dehydrogenase family protein, partial [Candidatus Promineifilaceae bacterium]|nr:aldehyde dehydrogenase family protein [Candidatus Promineifilaceae bacterium]
MNGRVETIPCVNPGTGEVFAEIPVATQEQIERAHREMKAAAAIWGRKPVEERIRILRKLQKMIIDSTDTITEVINKDTGKSRQDALIEIFMLVDRMHQYFRRAPKWLAPRRVPPGLYVFRRFYTKPQPFGVVAVICPWNYPFELSMSPMYSALLAGNTVLLKPSEATGALGQLIEQLIQSVPELSPFVRVLHGDGRVGAALVESEPDLVFLTGSVETGKRVAQAASRSLTPYLFELGGKDPMIVLEDADVPAAARWGTWSAFYNSGQTCVSIERCYVHEAVYDEFVREAVEQVKQLRVGYSPDIDNDFDLAPMTFTRQIEIIRDHLDDAVAKGARILIGGGIEGMIVKPTIVVNVDHTMKLMREETFGPILAIMKVRDEQEALRLANDSSFGLGASIWSADLRRAELLGEKLAVGSVNINDATAHYAVSLLPYGGMKESGAARTHGKEEVLQFTQLQSFAVSGPPLPFDLATIMRQPNHYRLAKGIMRLAFGETP